MSRVGRGGLKLAAALEVFGLADRVRGARAIDVGASTGGFTEVLLEAGATHVTAIDAGHGQLHPRLRDDPRVTLHEDADFKRLSLSEAPGPFDFFTVDVSFVAARNMLRGLAFRLRPGAEGVVLVKPQFELPEGKAGRAPEQDRRRALDKVADKGRTLGFVVRGSVDSAVAGGSGTVEVLAHLVFEGRTDRLPAPGEKRRAPEPPRPAAPPFETEPLRWFAIAAPGLEEVVAAELGALGYPGRVVEGGVELDGPLAVGLDANLRLRTATRVLLRVGDFVARDFQTLRRRAGKLPWERFLAPGAAVDVRAAAQRSRLYHTGGIAENLARAIEDRLGARPASGPPTQVLARAVQDRFTISIDSSGELLHRRGWRAEGGDAPMRETLAAALLHLTGWDPRTPLVDPMCGSGTLVIEAATLALGRAPGLGRGFAFERWPALPPGLVETLRERAAAGARDTAPAALIGSDKAAAAVEAARRNAERAGVAGAVTLGVRPLGAVEPPPERGLVLTNPPYGERLGASRGLYRDLGRLLDRFEGWQAGILTADPGLARALGRPARRAIPLRNGGLRVRLYLFGPSPDIDPRAR